MGTAGFDYQNLINPQTLESYMDLHDADSDGDLDLFVGTTGAPGAPYSTPILYRENTGTVSQAMFSPATTVTGGPPFTVVTPIGVADWDGDADADILTYDSAAGFVLIDNTGALSQPAWNSYADFPLGFDLGVQSRPNLIDFDFDGDLDLLIGSDAFDYYLFRNQGSATTPVWQREAIVTNFVEGVVDARFFSIVHDVNEDGSVDILQFLLQNPRRIEWLQNIGTTENPQWGNPIPMTLPGSFSGSPGQYDLGDLDGDGDLDFMSGASGIPWEVSSVLFRRTILTWGQTQILFGKTNLSCCSILTTIWKRRFSRRNFRFVCWTWMGMDCWMPFLWQIVRCIGVRIQVCRPHRHLTLR